jgi:predicted AlkP superfamily phosphohydrolase/phosphomutase/Flp pilus assembly protein TadD
MKRIVVIAAVVVVAALVAAALLFKRVPAGSEAVRVSASGDTKVFGSGYHLVMPGARAFVIYPTGSVAYRYPQYGAAEVLTESGEPVDVALEVVLRVPEGASRRLYERFSSDFESAVRRLLKASAEIEAAQVPPSVRKGDFLDAVIAGVRQELAGLGITIESYAMPVWGDERQAELISGAGVAESPPRKLIILGVDGGDWVNLDPLIEAGKLPNFARLVREGATGPLRTIEPMLSPLLWTTMATGKDPVDHGILNFTIADPATGKKVPITRYHRRVDAFWNMLGDYGRTVGIVGWLATHPAEKVNGTLITDKAGYLAFAPEDRGEGSPGSVYPESRTGEISELVVRGSGLDWEECREIVDVTRDEVDAHASLEFDPKDSLNNLFLMLASTKTFRNVGLHLLRKDRPDLLAVYFEWVDAVSHLFMLYAPPKMPDISDEDFRKYGNAIEQTYIVQDRILGEFIDEMDDDTILMVISDHGFKSGASRLKNRPEIWAGHAAKWHRLDGIVAFYGPGVKKGHKLEGASVMDVTPTVLAVQGLPRAADMPGRVLEDAFEPALVELFNNNVLQTLEREREREEVDLAAAGTASEEAMRKLQALGYIEADNADAFNNRGQRLQDRGDFLEAIEEYKKAIRMRPRFHSAYNNMAVCYGRLGRLAEAEQALKKTIEIKPDDFYAMNNLAVTYIQTNRMGEAQSWAERAVAIEPGYVNGHITLGSIYAMTGQLAKAEREFATAVELEPGQADSNGAADNLRKIRLQIQTEKQN